VKVLLRALYLIETLPMQTCGSDIRRDVTWHKYYDDPHDIWVKCQKHCGYPYNAWGTGGSHD